MDRSTRLKSLNCRAPLLAFVAFCALTPTMGLCEDGDVKLSPRLDIAFGRNDNFYYQSTNKTTVNGLIISPSVQLAAETARLRASASVSAPYGQFDTQGDNDNYFDQILNGKLEYKAGASQTILVDGGVENGHDTFGQTRTQGAAINTNSELDRWIQAGGELRYRLGAEDALFNFELSGSGSRKIYTTNTSLTEFLNYGTYGGSLAALVNISPKTAILAEGGYSETHIDRLFNAADRREAHEFFGRVGARWKATAKTTGDVRVGWAERSASATNTRTFQVLDWAASLAWQPVERTVLTVLTSRRSQESYISGASVILNRSAGLSWDQDWSRDWASTLSTSYIQSEFVDTTRTDDISHVGLHFNYKAQKYMRIGLGANYQHRYSTFPSRNYNGIYISSKVSLGF